MQEKRWRKWQEMITDPEQKIARPRQVYTGQVSRDVMPIG
jgi:citrate synthase